MLRSVIEICIRKKGKKCCRERIYSFLFHINQQNMPTKKSPPTKRVKLDKKKRPRRAFVHLRTYSSSELAGVKRAVSRLLRYCFVVTTPRSGRVTRGNIGHRQVDVAEFSRGRAHLVNLNECCADCGAEDRFLHVESFLMQLLLSNRRSTMDKYEFIIIIIVKSFFSFFMFFSKREGIFFL